MDLLGIAKFKNIKKLRLTIEPTSSDKKNMKKVRLIKILSRLLARLYFMSSGTKNRNEQETLKSDFAAPGTASSRRTKGHGSVTKIYIMLEGEP